MSSSQDKQSKKTWILVVLALIVIAFVGVSILPFLANRDQPQQATNGANQQQQEELADQARGYEAVLEREPDNENALQGLLEIRLQQGDVEGAIAPLEQLADLNPEQEAYRILLAQAKQETGDVEGAASAYRYILDEQPGDPRALQGLVDLYLQKDRPEAAIGELEETLELAENNEIDVDTTSIRLLLAQVYARMDDFDRAIALYQELAEADPSDFRPVLGQALVKQEQGDEEAAKPLYEEAFALAPAEYKDQIRDMTPLLDDENAELPEQAPESDLPAQEPETEEIPVSPVPEE
ncbi:tetratricopeptide repeat protein [Euhalothece natronophila Z-M001]|uniref:Tetratricopeptide repeat protein n=1 Tax=Euhalothece natronophila Z-M001 TaxID=522448 RepID=A0A5B8NIK5_9CHRO|nr:tetratricopeptide repeat protein [Euhalothece natronophila]QDZ39073.1 tetratricopeptide repeat protein [Euhalothece natronophila Z-M001]